MYNKKVKNFHMNGIIRYNIFDGTNMLLKRKNIIRDEGY